MLLRLFISNKVPLAKATFFDTKLNEEAEEREREGEREKNKRLKLYEL